MQNKPKSNLFLLILIAVVVAAISAGARLAKAEDAKSNVDGITKDFLFACEMSKLSINLAKTPEFKDNPAELAYRVAELMSAAFKTTEVKDTYKAISMANPDQRVKMWHDSAKELGVKNFKCKTIGFK